MKRGQSGGRVRKRTFVVTGVTLVCVILTSLLVTRLASSILGPEDLLRFSLHERPNRTAVLGNGISLPEVMTANLLDDTSFEPLVFRQSLMIISGDSTTLTVSSEEASAGLYGDGFFDQAVARVMSQTADGLVLKKKARVIHYGMNRVGVFQPVRLPGDVPERHALFAFARKGTVSLAVGAQGLIVMNVTGQMPEIVESGLDADLTGVGAYADGFMACSAQGDLLASPDGLTWTIVPSMNRQPLSAVALSDQGQAIAVGKQGTMVASQNGQSNRIGSSSTEDLHDIAWGLDRYVVVGNGDTILTSRNGLIWKKINLGLETDWQAIDYHDGQFVLVGTRGAIASSSNGLDFDLLQQDNDPDYVDVVMLSRQQTILLDADGGISVSNDSGETWLQSGIDTGMHSRVLALAGKDKILSADRDGKLGIAQLVAEIQLDSSLKDGQYQAGDRLFLEKESTSVPDAYLADASDETTENLTWTVFGPGEAIRTTDDVAPYGGKASMLLQGDDTQSDSPTILSQAIDAAKLDPLSANQALQVELWMKQSGVVDRQVQIWLSGPFQSIGTTLDNVGTTWKKYRFTFILPAKNSSLISKDQEARLNISINSGSLWLDRVYLGDAQESPDLLARKQLQLVSAISPQAIRLDFLNIGGATTATEGWAEPLGNDAPWIDGKRWVSPSGSSLHAALKLTEECLADPWLVVDLHASQSEMLNLIEYLAGPISEPYGKLRQELGSFMAWTDTFDRLVIEFIDRDQILSSDSMKAAQVDLMISTISQSPYYRTIKGKLVFVDGMEYSDGVMLSSADYHATDVAGVLLEDSYESVDRAYQAYYDLLPRDPEKSGQPWPELIRSATLRQIGTQQANLADLINLAMRDLGRQTGLANLTLAPENSQTWSPALTTAARIAAAASSGVPMQVIQLQASTGEATAATDGDLAAAQEAMVAETAVSAVPERQEPVDRVQVFAFNGDAKTSIVLNNLTGNAVTCLIITDIPLRGAAIEKYDAEGKLIGRQTMKNNDAKITVLPGGTVFVVKGSSPNSVKQG
jgi:hypothetical protein